MPIGKSLIGIEIKANDKASRALQGIQGNIQRMSKQMRMAGIGMVAAGGAIVASMAVATKAAAKEQAGITRLSVAMKNMGLSYEGVQGSLEEWIDTQQQKTAIADDEQRDSLAQLIGMTGNLAEAQDYLTVAMDMAAGTGKDLASATTLIGYAMSGNWGMVGRLIPAIKNAKTEEEKWMMLRTLFVGQAEAYGRTMAGQAQLLQHNLGDIKEAIGSLIIDAIGPLFKQIASILPKVKDWISDNKEMVRTIVLVTGVIGAVLVPLGALLILLPMIAAGFAMVTAAAPWLLLGGAIAVVIAGMVALGIAIDKNKYKVAELSDYSKDVLQTHKDMAREVLTYQADIARQTTQDQKIALNTQLDDARFAHGERMSMMDAEYKAKLLTLDAETAADLLALQEQINAMDDQTQAEERALRDREDATRESALRDEIARETDSARRAYLQEQLSSLLASIERRRLLEQRTDEKDALRERMDEIRQKAQAEKDRLAEELAAQKQAAIDALAATEERVKKENEALDKALATDLKRIAADVKAVEQAEGAKLVEVLVRLEAEYEAIKAQREALTALPPVVLTTIHEHVTVQKVQGSPGSGGVGGTTDVYEFGGPMQQTRPVRLQQGGAAPLERLMLTIPIYLDGELIAEKVVERVGDTARLQGY